ncbi:GTP-binding protein [Rhabdaerophilum sp. SD176]|uniref:sulfate adenylyltransferase subunit 1 n=1 Tax=Rhabdaerophilum sp. SD176 TaxID=2983548 RepID=UPI0024DF7352|nr:GTP-binding protein [Rhabdaerophilum sp. SD176]
MLPAMLAARHPEPDMPDVAAALRPAERSLLRFITCGSVDDGKSTLLGRLLWETGAVYEDQAEALARDSERFGTDGKNRDFALLVDGLSAEREQGITIDVAYRYFATPRRAFIAADTPGHEQYTRNMATGASTADVAILLVDARKGVLPQTRRHSSIVSLVGVRDVILAMNKMDLVGFDEAVFRRIEAEYRALVARLGFRSIHVLPLVARDGDTLTRHSGRMPWYAGPTLLDLLETLEPALPVDGRFFLPVQWVNRPNADFRGFSGTVASGQIRVGDPVTILPQGRASRIAEILTPEGARNAAKAGEAVTVTLADETDVARGDVITVGHRPPHGTGTLTVRLLVLGERVLAPGDRLLLKLGSATVPVRFEALTHELSVEDLTPRPARQLAMNGIGKAVLRPEAPLFALPYNECQPLGSFLLIDPMTHATLAMGVIETASGPSREASPRHSAPVHALLLRFWPSHRPEQIRSAITILLFALTGFLLTGTLADALILAALDGIGRPLLITLQERFWPPGEKPAPSMGPEPGLDGGGI